MRGERETRSGGVAVSVWGEQMRYWNVYQPTHPRASKDGYVLEHRLVMEKTLGRYLTQDEVVHHLNGDPTDNHPENLSLLPGQSEHARAHDSGRIRDP